MKKTMGILSILLALTIVLSGCTRNYSEWSPVYCDSIGYDNGIFAEVPANNRTAFYVPDEWICSRIGNYIFFASYEIDDLNDILRPGEELYLLGWIATTEEEALYYDVTRLFDTVTIPPDSAMFSARLNTLGAVLGREKYDIGGEGQAKYYITLRSNEFYEIKLIDWQDACGKELIRKIGNSFTIKEVPRRESGK